VVIRCLTITRPDSGTVLIIWTGGGVLERTTALGGVWEPVRTAASPFRVSVSGQAQQFYRIHY
jgi:hypothetical protein